MRSAHKKHLCLLYTSSRELRSELGISPFILTSGAFTHPDVTATISEGNIWDFHGGEMETSMVMAVDESLVKLELSEAGIPSAFEHNQALKLSLIHIYNSPYHINRSDCHRRAVCISPLICHQQNAVGGFSQSPVINPLI